MRREEVVFVIVEDDDVDVMVLKRSFLRLKIANPIVIARDGIEALDILRGENGKDRLAMPYILLIDLNMPRMNGIEFLETIRQDPILRRTVAFVLTTSKDERDKLKAYDNHIAGYIVKNEDCANLCFEALKMLDQYWRVVELPVT